MTDAERTEHAARLRGPLHLAYHHTREHQRTYPDQHDYQLGA